MGRRKILADIYWIVLLGILGLLVTAAFSGSRPQAVTIGWILIGLAILVPVAMNFPTHFFGSLMPPVWRVARATFHEAWRRRFLNGILIFAVLIIGSSWALAYLQPGAELKMLIDIGLGATRFSACSSPCSWARA